jgi:hypothetical protein
MNAALSCAAYIYKGGVFKITAIAKYGVTEWHALTEIIACPYSDTDAVVAQWRPLNNIKH